MSKHWPLSCVSPECSGTELASQEVRDQYMYTDRIAKTEEMNKCGGAG